MILPDANILIYARRKDDPNHAVAREFVSQLVEAELAIADIVLLAVVRILTNPRSFARPEPLDDVVRAMDTLRSQPNARLLLPSASQWAIFGRLCVEANARGNLITDAYIASLAIANGCELASADRDFLRFPALRLTNPILNPQHR